jgi:RecA-family ATPase
MPVRQPDLTATPEEQKKTTMLDAIRMAARDTAGIEALGLPPRNPILSNWFKEGDCGFIYAPRGLGKTWITLAISGALANGRQLGPWQAHGVWSVCYVDGEMAVDGMLERMHGMEAGPNLSILNHEALFHLSGKVLNIAEPETRQALMDYCLETSQRVLVLDNLSCLASGMEENRADHWEAVADWLLAMRRHKVAVIIVHHAGRNGEMRGTSKREDAAFWVLRLDAVDEEKSGTDRQARFVSRFTKERNSGRQQPPLEWTFQTGADGITRIGHKEADKFVIFRQWIESGLNTATDIATEMGLTKGTISKMAKAAVEAGWLAINGRRYTLVS